jgi:hypothetical protein
MKKSKAGIVVPTLIIALGIAWLLNTLHVLPGVDWMWTGGLGVCGILVVAIGGINKLSAVVGPFLLVGSVLSVLRQTGRLSVDIEMPVLFIVFGVLLLLAYLLPLPMPEFLQRAEPGEGK